MIIYDVQFYDRLSSAVNLLALPAEFIPATSSFKFPLKLLQNAYLHAEVSRLFEINPLPHDLSKLQH